MQPVVRGHVSKDQANSFAFHSQRLTIGEANADG
jgi:hypothetical protein